LCFAQLSTSTAFRPSISALGTKRLTSTLYDIICIFTYNITYLKPKDSDTKNPSKYRPITCLPTIYKIMTSCIKVIIYDHCQKLNIINEEQKGCVKECFGCKEQLIIDTVIMEQARKNNRNIYTAFIDYKKAYDSVPHSWLIKILKYLKYELVLRNVQIYH
jgi:hypothetical protein